MGAKGQKLIKARRRAANKHAKIRVRREDRVQVMAGDERGKIGKVLHVLPSRQRVVVEGVNLVFKHVRKSQKNPQGGRIEREAAVPLSSVMLYCSACNKGSRVRVRVENDQKSRVCAKCGAGVGQ